MSSRNVSLYRKFLDPTWRLNNLYRIIDKKNRRVKFTPNPIQARINACDSPRKLILKARQFGVTTGEVIKKLDTAMFNRNITAVIMAHEKDGIEKIFRIVRRAYEFMPDPLKPRIDRGGGSKYEMFFPEINSRIYCDLESRGDTISELHISEAAFADRNRLLSTLQAVPLGGKVTLESTPNGLGNLFYDYWVEDQSTYERLFYPWFLHDEYKIAATYPVKLTVDEKIFCKKVKNKWKINISKEQILYRRFKQKELKELYVQEYPEDDISCFLASGKSVIDLEVVKSQYDALKPPIRVIEPENIEIYEERNQKAVYAIGADPAQGVGNDRSVATVFDVISRKEVAFVSGQFSPFVFANLLNELGKMFATGMKMPLLAVENNNHGHAVLLQLMEHIHYPHLYFTNDDENKPGWTTDKITRPVMMETYLDGVANQTIEVRSKQTLLETMTLVNINGKIQADKNKHDDAVMATAIVVQMITTQMKNLKLYDGISSKILI